MVRNLIIAVLVLFSSLSFVKSSFYQSRKKSAVPISSLKDQLSQLMVLFEGEFDNFQQVYKEKEDEAKEAHEHIHSIFAPVKLPSMGNHVLYVYQYKDGDKFWSYMKGKACTFASQRSII